MNTCVFLVFCRGPYLEQRGTEGLKQEWFTKYFSFWAQKHTLTHTHTYTHKHTHTCSSCKYISSYTVHCFLYTSVCFQHTHKHTHKHKHMSRRDDINRHMGSSPARPSQTLPQSSTKKCFSNTCLTSFSEHRPAGSCLYSLECLHIFF